MGAFRRLPRAGVYSSNITGRVGRASHTQRRPSGDDERHADNERHHGHSDHGNGDQVLMDVAVVLRDMVRAMPKGWRGAARLSPASRRIFGGKRARKAAGGRYSTARTAGLASGHRLHASATLFSGTASYRAKPL